MNILKFQLCTVLTLAVHLSCSALQPEKHLDSLNLLDLKIDTLHNHLDTLQIQLNALKEKVAILEKKKNSTRLDWIIIMFMPASMFIFTLYFIFKFWNSKNFTISNIIGLNDEKGDKATTQSTSRFILLLTGLTSIFVVNTLMMYYGYILVFGIEKSVPVDDLWKILAGLGIGIVPYGINVWNGNVKEVAATGTSDKSPTPQT